MDAKRKETGKEEKDKWEEIGGNTSGNMRQYKARAGTPQKTSGLDKSKQRLRLQTDERHILVFASDKDKARSQRSQEIFLTSVNRNTGFMSMVLNGTPSSEMNR